MIEMTLEEDLPDEFRGGTLRIHPDNKLPPHANPNPNPSPDKIDNSDNSGTTKISNNSNSNCHWGTGFLMPLASVPNKISETLWSSKPTPAPVAAAPQPKTETSIQPSMNINEDANNFFTFREGVVDKAVKDCVEQFLDIETEGPLLASYLLTQINHWDTDKERLVLLTPKSLVIAKYDFIALRRLGCKKLPLEDIDQVVVGDLVYPNASLIPDRKMKGIRIIFNKDQPINFKTKWNPFNDSIPFWTFTFHPLYFHKDCSNETLRNLYNMELFTEKLCIALSELKKNAGTCIVMHNNILLDSYVGLGSIIHNRNSLGFFKVRGKFSF